MSFLEGQRIFTGYLLKDFIEIGDAFKSALKGSFGYVVVLSQKFLGLIDAVVVEEFCEGQARHAFEITAKSSVGEVAQPGDFPNINLALVTFVKELVNAPQADLLFLVMAVYYRVGVE